MSDLRDCLCRMATSLEKGDAVEAAAVLPELKAIVGQEPVEMETVDLEDARALLTRCEDAERRLREETLAALRQLGATRRSEAYRQGRP